MLTRKWIKKKAQKADLLRDGNQPPAPRLPRSLFSCQAWESKAPEGPCLQNNFSVSISTPTWMWYQLEELLTWVSSCHPPWASLQHLSPYSHLPIFITGALECYRNGNYPDDSLRTQTWSLSSFPMQSRCSSHATQRYPPADTPTAVPKSGVLSIH